jgi:two-component system cell cycle sensor histidine kinase/response regulator CckA
LIGVERPDIEVIFISGYSETTFKERLDEGGGIHFLPKPFSLKQLAGHAGSTRVFCRA